MTHQSLFGRADGCMLGFSAESGVLHISSTEAGQPTKTVTIHANMAELDALARAIERAREGMK